MADVDQRSVTFSQAIRSKYFDSLEVSDNVGISFSTYGGKQRSLEYARSDKLNRQLKCLEKRTELDLRNCFIDQIDIDSDLMSNFKNIKFLDISNNLLTTWNQVATIISCLPSLDHIIVNGNPINPKINYHESQQLSKYFKQINSITMGKLNYDWENVCNCSQLLWPHIEYLDVFANSIKVINQLDKTLFNSLTTLILSDNQIVDWNYVNSLSHLQGLMKLQLVNCSLKSIQIPDSIKPFPKLKHLDLKNNNIESWKDIANLNKLPALEELIVRGNPLFDDIQYDYAFNFVVGIVGNLKYLNRQQITKTIRKDSEIHYLRFYYPKYLKCVENNTTKAFLEENPRYLELIEEYGEPLDLTARHKKDKPSKLVQLNIINPSNGSIVNKKVPRTIAISTLKTLVKRLLSIDDMEDITLWVKSSTDYNQCIEYPMDREDFNLDFYSIKDNSQLFVKFDQ